VHLCETLRAFYGLTFTTKGTEFLLMMHQLVNLLHIFSFFHRYVKIFPFGHAECEADIAMGRAQYQSFFAIREREHTLFHIQLRGKILEHFKLLGCKVQQQVSQPDVKHFTFHTLADNDGAFAA